ncbi:MAG: hypothetical protein J0L75_08295, partial [Spirochaetes bacterium]|nr:hypothetical protein [Spirochaetota bacterium]
LSFAHEFKTLTTADALEREKGAWYFGNAAGPGRRWGNGLNVKNEVRALNQPYTGKAQVGTHCFLPGCNGVRAGKTQEVQIHNGQLAVTLEVGGHSGPFDIEVVTEKGSVSHLFGRSGHVERQTIALTRNMKKRFIATLAPYEKTAQVRGRDLFIGQDGEDPAAPFQLESPVAGPKGELALSILREGKGLRAVLWKPRGDGRFEREELATAGGAIRARIPAPYGLLGVAGFFQGQYREGWALCFPESRLEATVSCADSGAPNRPIAVSVKLADRALGRGVAGWGILEVFDNRVLSKSPKEGLASALGDSLRGASATLSAWRDLTGLDEERDELRREDKPASMKLAPSAVSRAMGGAAALDFAAPSPKRFMLQATKAGAPQRALVAAEPAAEEGAQEAIREGERKVLWCGLVKTAPDGTAQVSVPLPPQTGRCTVRFAAVDRYDYAEDQKGVDVTRRDFLELSLPAFLTSGSRLSGRALVSCATPGAVLTAAGDGLERPWTRPVALGAQEIEIELSGDRPGRILFTLSDGSGKVLDKREWEIRNPASFPMTGSDLRLSTGAPIAVDRASAIAVYANPAAAMDQVAMTLQTTLLSWFGHSEALAASAAARAIVLRAMDEKLIGSGGLRDSLRLDLAKSVKDLEEAFFDPASGLLRPYPGLPVSRPFTALSLPHLNRLARHLAALPKSEFGDTAVRADRMIRSCTAALGDGAAEFPALDGESIPVEMNGKVVWRAPTDPAVAKWFVQKALPALDLDGARDARGMQVDWIRLQDTWRFLRSFERVGAEAYLIPNARALYLARDGRFAPLFNRIARGLLLTGEPGLLQGPALLGGVYASSGALLPFLELLLDLSRDHQIAPTAEILISRGKRKERAALKDRCLLLGGEGVTAIEAPAYAVVRIDERREVDLEARVTEKPFFRVHQDAGSLAVGQKAAMSVELDASCDPNEYVATVALPATLSLIQSDDLLSDYKGELLYGQRRAGGQKTQLLTVPFRGSRLLSLTVEATARGESEGLVFVRHVTDFARAAAMRTPMARVR